MTLKKQFWFFPLKFAQKWCFRFKTEKSEYHHWIQHTQISVSTSGHFLMKNSEHLIRMGLFITLSATNYWFSTNYGFSDLGFTVLMWNLLLTLVSIGSYSIVFFTSASVLLNFCKKWASNVTSSFPLWLIV